MTGFDRLILAGSVLLAVAGCEGRVSLGARCESTAECPAGLSCTAGRCRAGCATERDCEEGRRCLEGPGGVGICSTEPEDRCASVSDCLDPLFAACTGGRCQTACTRDAECAGGVCVEGSCVERRAVQAQTSVAAVALGAGARGEVGSRSFVLPDPSIAATDLTFGSDPRFSDVDVVLEDPATAGAWSVHVATMRSDSALVGRPMLVDVDLSGGVATRTFVNELPGSDTTSVAAEAMGEGGPAYFWVVETPDPPSSPDYPLRFAFYQRGTGDLQSMGTMDERTRFPAQAALASGMGATRDQPSWGTRVVETGASFYMAVGPSGGAGSQVNLPVGASSGEPVDARGTRRAFLFRLADGSLHLGRLTGDDILDGAVQDLRARSSCAPGIADRSVLQEGNYVLATCSGAIVELRRIRCSTIDDLRPCELEQWLQLPQASAPSEVLIEPLRAGVAVLSRTSAGVDGQIVPDDAMDASAAIGFEQLLPASYRVNAVTDFELRHVAATTAWREGAAVIVLAGLYHDLNDVGQIRLGVVDVEAL